MATERMQVERVSAGRSFLWPQAPLFILRGEAVKCCPKCARVKKLDGFGPGSDWDGLAKRCLECSAP